MRRRLSAVLFALTLAFPLLALSQPAPAAAPATAAPAAQDSPTRAPGQAPAPAASAADGEAAEAPPEEAPAAAPEPVAEPVAPAEPQTLVADGLLAQIFARVEMWAAGLVDEVAQATAALSDVRLLGTWWSGVWADDDARMDMLQALLLFAGILAVALLAEGIVIRLLRRARHLVAAQADAQEARAQARAAAREAEIAAMTPAVVADPTGAPDIVSESEAQARIDAGMVEPATVSAATPITAPAHASAASPAAEATPAATAALHHTLREATLERLHERRKAMHRWGLLGRLPWALAHALLSIVPLAAFLAVVAMGMAWQGGEGTRFSAVTLPIFNAYVSVRLAMAVMRLMASPTSPGLRLIHVSTHTATLLFRRACVLFIVMGIGVASSEVLVQLGAADHVRVLIMKTTSLIVHLMLIALVFATRERTQAAIRGTGDHAGRLRPVRAFLADLWPFAATAVIITFWVVWAMGVPNGFQRAIHFLAITAAVLAGARLLWILLIGALDRSFERANLRIENVVTSGAERYHAWLRILVNIIVIAATVVILLEMWGLEAFSWFGSGTVGRRLLSAAWTIGIAAALAIVVWESVSLALRRRIQSWTDAGDAVRAARLRTLVPMIRTVVLVVIGLVVVFTALSELGINAAPLLAGASIIGVALGFGSQTLVRDFITGIFLLMENAMQVGDSVTVAGVSGNVEYLSIRTVRLRAGDGSLHVIPFSSVTTVNNVNRGLGTAPVKLTVLPSADLDAVFAALRQQAEQMQADPKFAPLMLGPLEIFGVDQIDGATVTIGGQIRTTDKGRWPVTREFNRRVLNEVVAGRIVLANPRETVVTQAQPGQPAPVAIPTNPT